MISDLVITYGGEKLTNYFDLTAEPIGRNVHNRENSLQQMGLTNGSHFIGTRYKERIITLNIYSNKYSVDYVKNKINGLLNVKEPQPLIFSDRPNEVWYAILDGESAMTRSIDSLTEISGELSFLVPSGYCEALIPSKYTATQNDDGILAMQIANNGTETAELSFEATMTSDNGFLGAVGPLGAMEFGNIAEVDGHSYQKTDVVAKNSLTPDDKTNWLENSPNVQTVYPIAPAGIPNKIGQGSFSWAGEAPTPNYPNNPDECWIGPTLSRDIPKNSNEDNTGNFDAIWRGTFSTKTVKEVGREEFNLVNGNQIVCAFVIRDSSYSKQALTCDYYIYLNGERDILYTFDVDLKKAQSSWFEIRISRIDAAFTFKFSTLKSIKNDEANLTYFTNTKTFTKDEYANVPITGTHFWPHAKWANRPVARLGMSNFIFRWINVDKWSDDPNRYTTGDVLSYDGTTGKFYVNEVLAMNDIIIGSTDLKIPPGSWLVEFHYSDFGKTPPNIVGTLRERWL